MSKDKIIFKLIQAQIAFQILYLSYCQEYVKINNCVVYVNAPSRFYHNLFDQQLCIECEFGYIVSKNYKYCIDFRYELSYLQYGNCKRLAQDGSCAEALNGIELLPNNQYTIVKDQKFFERCAIVNDNETECLFPRFGFILDIQNKYIYKDTHKTFCALFDSYNKDCKKFHQRFFRYLQTQQGVYLGENVLNPDKLISIFEQQLCAQNFSYFENKNIQQYGCIPKKIENIKYFRICNKDEALREDKLKCQIVIPNCQEYQEIQGKDFCTKCEPFYKLNLQNCTKMIGCIYLSRKYPNKCIKCDQFSILLNGECIQNNNLKRFVQNIDENDLEKKQTLNTIYQLQDFDKQSSQGQKDKKELYQNPLEKNMFKKSQEIMKDENYLHKGFFNKRKLDAQIIFDPDLLKQNRCLYKIKDKCIQCYNPYYYYLDEQKNECIERVKSLYCQNCNFNSDDCLNLLCKERNFLNQIFVDNFDLKNKQTLKYFVYLEGLFFDNDYEIKKLSKIYQFYGINLNNTDQICLNYYKYLNINEQVYYFFNYENINCLEQKKIISIKKDLQYLYIQCSNEINSKNLTFDKCVQYNDEKSFCLECEEGFYFNSLTMICEKKIENCILHSINNTCIICESGYQLINENRCSPICGSFIPGNSYYFNSIYIFSSNSFNQTVCNKTNTGCRIFINQICVECFEGYVQDYSLQKNNCILDYNFPDCKIIDIKQDGKFSNKSYIHDGKQCIQCYDGYVLFQGLCYCQRLKCLKYIYCDDNICFKKFWSLFIGQLNLVDNQYLEKYGEQYKVRECLIDNCQICHEGDICLKCRYGFYLEENQRACILKKEQSKYFPIKKLEDSNCLIFSSDRNYCIKCQPNYFLRQDLKCYEHCEFDEEIYIYSEEDNFCYQCPIGCSRCQFEPDKFFQQQEMPCFKCLEGYFFYKDFLKCRKFCVFYQYQNNECVVNCSKDLFLLKNECVKTCPYYYFIEEKQNVCIENCGQFFRFDDDPLRCAQDCPQQYFKDKDNLICRECLVENCEICSQKHQNICIKCKGDYLNAYGKCVVNCANQLNKNNQNNCLKQLNIQCLAYEIFNYMKWKCYQSCDENCLVCNKTYECVKCIPDKYLEEDSIKNRCIDKCQIGYYPQIKYNDQNFKLCLKCTENCFSCEDSKSCTECNPQYKSVSCNGMTVCLCEQKGCNKKYDMTYYKMTCCPIQNCSQCSKIQTCEKCEDNNPYLYHNTCLQYCPNGTYSDENKKCHKCHPLCKECTDSSSKNCLSCVLPKHILESENTCKCRNKKVFFQNECYSICPRFTKIQDENDRVCEQYCVDQLSYPVFDQDGLFEKCENQFDSQDSKFCDQNLINLHQNMKFIVKNNLLASQSQIVEMDIIIQQTPRECYNFQLKINPYFQEEDFLSLEFQDFKIGNFFYYEFRLSNKIEIELLKQKDQNNCKQNTCTLYLQIYHQNLLKKTIKLNLDIKSLIMDIQSVNFPFLNDIVKQQIINDKENKRSLNSIMTLQCQNYTVCNDEFINIFPSSLVNIRIQALQDDKQQVIKKLLLFPVQIQIAGEDSQVYEVRDFFYNNDQPSQIRIEFNFANELKGKLKLVLKAVESQEEQLKYEQFVDKNQEIYFINQNINILIEKYQQNYQKVNANDKDDNQIEYLILFIINSMICLIIIALILFKFFKEKLKTTEVYSKQVNEKVNHQVFQMDQFSQRQKESQLQEKDIFDQI